MHNGVEVRSKAEDQFVATSVTTNPETIARQFAVAIRDNPAVEQLWLVSDPDSMELIAVTSDADAETERRIYGVFGDLIAQHPTAAVFPRLLNPRFFVEGTDMQSLLPRRARQIPLRD